jgi:hypothetical protein
MSKGGKFGDLIDKKMEELDIWLKKLELANPEERIPTYLYKGIKKYVQNAFVNDFNLIIEEYKFYYQLPPILQTEV